ncbi:hypothetical protein R1sor_015012 [Riccia sorocarpa]|uniref:Ribose-phosphate pyrophosphokinase N-terminal domain-containing protein n=1 Tax=Riccia sorocarpa TaxID=122646 RepID=A0ABD3HBG2_9MARC
MDSEGVLSFEESLSTLVFQMDLGAGRGAWEIASTSSCLVGPNSFVCKVDEGKIQLADCQIMDNVSMLEIITFHPVYFHWRYNSYVLTQPSPSRSLGRFPVGTMWVRPGVLSRSPVARVNGTLYGVEKEGVSVWDSVSVCSVANNVDSASWTVFEDAMKLLVMIAACLRASAKTITTVIPYFGYARADRKPVILDYLASKMISADTVVVVSPDVGVGARTRAFAKKLSDAPLATVDKRRRGHNISEVTHC